MARVCQICVDQAKRQIALEMIAAGASDQAVANKIGGINRMAAARHRRNHVELPTRALVAAAAKGRDAREQRKKAMAAAQTGDPLAFVELSQIVADLRGVHARLERTADAAEQDNQRLAVSALSAQQLRAAEVRAKLGGVGGYAPPKAALLNAPTFVLNIQFSGGRSEKIEASVADGSVIDATPIVDEEEDVEIEDV